MPRRNPVAGHQAIADAREQLSREFSERIERATRAARARYRKAMTPLQAQCAGLGHIFVEGRDLAFRTPYSSCAVCHTPRPVNEEPNLPSPSKSRASGRKTPGAPR